jgi:hypothetical protein
MHNGRPGLAVDSNGANFFLFHHIQKEREAHLQSEPMWTGW